MQGAYVMCERECVCVIIARYLLTPGVTILLMQSVPALLICSLMFTFIHTGKLLHPTLFINLHFLSHTINYITYNYYLSISVLCKDTSTYVCNSSSLPSSMYHSPSHSTQPSDLSLPPLVPLHHRHLAQQRTPLLSLQLSLPILY